jgi:tRNA (guanine-N7-)-methyltransferase
MALYKSLMKPDGIFHLKTDNQGLFFYTLEVLREVPHKGLVQTANLYNSPLLSEHFGIQTNFERKYLSKNQPIYYLRFQFLV